MKKKRLLFLIAAWGFFISNSAFAYDIVSYWMNQPGCTRYYNKYEDAVMSGKMIKFEGGYQSINDTLTVQSWIVNIDSADEVYTPQSFDLFSYDNVNIYLHGYNQISGGGGDQGLYKYSPALSFPRNMNVGDSSTGSTTVTAPGGSTSSVSITIQLLAVENVSVYAGAFNNCLKLSMGPVGEIPEIQWWAKGVGEVKMQKLGTPVKKNELTSYHIPAKRTVVIPLL